ncbi:MAG TPA: peroxiredoxin [Spirochaetia bacterium]|nr:peroxiredoxin [Spirochaetia bacterium]
MLEEGSIAPDFTLDDDVGKPVSLSSFRGRKVVLYFYPKDDTSGCTKEACGFRDAYGSFIEKGAVVVGVSPDESGSHARFKAKYGLPFVLLADPEHRALEAYGVWAEKSMYGRKYMGVVRSTYVIGEDGVILKAFPKVSPEGHAVEILAAL